MATDVPAKLHFVKYEILVPVMAKGSRQAVQLCDGPGVAWLFCETGLEASVVGVSVPETLKDLPNIIRDQPPINDRRMCHEIVAEMQDERDKHQLKLFG